MIFVGLYWLFPKIREALAIVKPETVVRWHRAGFRSYWRWKSRARGGLLLSYMNYYNEARTHLSLEKDYRSRATLSGPDIFFAVRSWAGCITYIFGFDLRQVRDMVRKFGRDRSEPIRSPQSLLTFNKGPSEPIRLRSRAR